ncbi:MULTISPECIES: DUF2235 domain-containing protein [unclassified Undibacterium]|uniref:DUF2235 domain-containing protein n=1 Tax=unclassified Undibacterium TaxID=2630295 RepID=UPI002AC9D0C1|nr:MULTISPECIES: DUF2235 domain-containing protein [unclassified Undibacterium]MEB0140174.1 DUF2235 domain-containing protein [Undibacterium sp. CCC2.1]MEB0172452.1 DUF2235 domain-containing protein [Undibacterium sp. CCC1.1]MEB0176970.1 DUF2235 domain-containing protein [Undibacterium sp. CCC3.4]MEB0215574.1 DUF2235 domain-containing protein [Undibacterium sp. 5I2]WPX43719.1 DUF2235 domain-containing protein [Undibacterium sp. CCC3.4]
MLKTIVFCADGTWNGPGKDIDDASVKSAPSNVLKLYCWLDGVDSADTQPFSYAGEAERVLLDVAGHPLQLAKYLDGVGYDDNWLVKFLGGTFGAGLVTRIIRGYTFISRHYQPGDRIVINGFSRGAYTARALAAMILDQGLLDAGKIDLNDKEHAYRLGCAVWHAHRKKAAQGKLGLLTRLEECMYDMPDFFTQTPSPQQLIGAVPIQCVAVWDTVGAMGVPLYDGEDRRIDAFRFTDCDFSARVAHGFHAIAVDEQRTDFTPTLWNPRQGISQVLFPGSHSDVGGGYPPGSESGLSDGALLWMKQQLEAVVGLRFGAPPQHIKADVAGSAHQPWRLPPYTLMPASHVEARQFPNSIGLQAHASLSARRNLPSVQPDPLLPAVAYAPLNIPAV